MNMQAHSCTLNTAYYMGGYGDVPQKWISFFCNKSLNMGPRFPEKSLTMGLICKIERTPENFENFVCFCGKIGEKTQIWEPIFGKIKKSTK